MRFNPRYKLLVTYDIDPNTLENYFPFVLNDFVPYMASVNVPMWRVYETVYGDYPQRQLEFLAEDLDEVRDVLHSDDFLDKEAELQQYVTNYSRKLVEFKDVVFQS